MAKVSFAQLNLKVNTDVNTFSFFDKKIEVLKYLPIQDKYDLIMIALQKAKEDEIYNEIKLDMYFHLYLVYMYTNLSFTEKQKEDEMKIYDSLKSNGFFELFLATIDEAEYNELWTMMTAVKQDKLNYGTTAVAAVEQIMAELPNRMASASDIIDNFDPTKYSQVVELAKAAGKRD